MRTYREEDFKMRPEASERRFMASMYIMRHLSARDNENRVMTARQERTYGLALILEAQTISEEFVRISDVLLAAAAETKPMRVDWKKTDLSNTLKTQMGIVHSLFYNVDDVRSQNKPRVARETVNAFVAVVSKLRQLLEQGARYQKGNVLVQLLRNDEFNQAAHQIHDNAVRLLKDPMIDDASRKKLEAELPRIKSELDAVLEETDRQTKWKDIKRLASEGGD